MHSIRIHILNLIINTAGMQEFEQTLRLLLSSSQVDRNRGQTVLENYMLQPDGYKYLLYGLSLPQECASLSAILFRQKYIETTKFKSLTAAEQLNIKDYLLSSLTIDKPQALLKSIGYLLVKMSAVLGTTEELSLFTINCSKTLELQEFSLYLTELLMHCKDFFPGHVSNTLAMLYYLSSSDSQKVRILSSKALCELSQISGSPIPGLSDRISCTIQELRSHECLSLLLESLAKLLEEAQAQQFPVSDSFVKSLIDISKDRGLSPPSRVSSTEVLLSMDLTRLPVPLLQEILVLGFNLLTEVDYYNDLQAWSLEINEVNSISNDSFSLGKDLLASIAKIGRTRKFVIELCRGHLSASHWVHQHAGIFSYGILCNHSQTYIAEVAAVIPFLQSQNPRLQWAALTVISSLFIKYPQAIQESYEVLPTILQLMQSPLLKVQFQAVVSLRCYFQGSTLSTSSFLTASTSTVSSMIYTVLSTPSLPSPLLSELLTLLATFYQASGSEIPPLTDKFIEGVRNIIMSNTLSSIRASAITCIGCIIDTLANKACASSVLQELLGLVGSDELITNAVIESVSQYAGALQQDFYGYAKDLVQLILANAAVDVRLKSLEASQKVMVLAVFELNGVEENEWRISADDLSKKISACKSLVMMAMLGPQFDPWTLATVDLVCPLMHYPYNKGIRNYAMRTVREICKRCGNFAEIWANVVRGVFGALMESVDAKNCEGVLEVMCGCLGRCVEMSLLGIEAAERITEGIAVKVKNEIQRIADAGYRESSKVITNSAKVIELFFKTFRNQYQRVFDSHLKAHFDEVLLSEQYDVSELIPTIGVFCDYIEYTSAYPINTQYSLVLMQFIKNCYHENSTIRHNSAYGIGLYASTNSEEIKNSLEHCINGLIFILNHPKSKEDLLETSECAAGALAKISLMFRNDLIPLWIQWFPLKSDAQETHEFKQLFQTHFHTIQQYGNVNHLLGIIGN